MPFDIKLNQRFLCPIGAFLWGNFLGIPKLTNPYKIASSLSNAITFLEKDLKQ